MYYCLMCESLFDEPAERYDPVDPSRIELVCPNCGSIDYEDEEELDAWHEHCRTLALRKVDTRKENDQ